MQESDLIYFIGTFSAEVFKMKMDVSELSFHELEEIVSRMDRLFKTSCLHSSGGRLELRVY